MAEELGKLVQRGVEVVNDDPDVEVVGCPHDGSITTRSAPAAFSEATRNASAASSIGKPVRDEGAGDVGIIGQHGRRVLHLAAAVVRAIAKRRDNPGLLVEEGHPVQLHGAEVDAKDDNRPPGSDELAALRQTRLGSGRLDHDVVEAGGTGMRAQPLSRFLLMGVARLECDVRCAEASSPGHGEQPEGTRADDRDTRARSGLGQAERMPRDRGRLHDGGIAYIDAGRQGDQAGRRRPEVLRHATVGADAEGPLAMGRAQVVGTAGTLRALHAAVDGLDHHGRAVLPHTRKLMAENGAAAESDVAQVGPADARGLHFE